jgi:hypothetical protein
MKFGKNRLSEKFTRRAEKLAREMHYLTAARAVHHFV